MSAMHPYHRTRSVAASAALCVGFLTSFFRVNCSGGGVNVAKTLDLLKAVLQSSFNMEVKRLALKF